MESSVVNVSSEVISVSGMPPGLSNVTTLSTPTSESTGLTQDDGLSSSIPSLFAKLFSRVPDAADIQLNDTTFVQMVDNATTSGSIMLSTEFNRTSDIPRTFLNNLENRTTPTMKFDSETSSSSLFPLRELNVSTVVPDSTTSISVNSFDIETDIQNIFGQSISSLPVKTENVEQSTFREFISSQASAAPDILRQSTELGSEMRSLVTDGHEDIPDMTTYSLGLKTTAFPATTETEMTTTVAEQTNFPSDVSSLLHRVFSTDHETDSTVLFNTSLYTATTTTPPVLLSDFTNNSSNATDVVWQYPSAYDIIIDEYDDSTAAMVAKVTTLAILAVSGVIGNAMVIWSVVRQKHLHRPPFYYLLSLSLTDLSRAAFCLPLVLMTLLQGSVWRHGSSACDLFAFANAFFVLSSGVSLLDIAADRHLSLVYTRSYRRRSGGALNLVVVLLGWSLAFLVAFPPVVGVGSYAFEESEGQCTLRHKFFRHNNDTLGFLMVFTVLMLVTLFLYYRIFLALRAHRKMRPLDHQPARSATWTFVGPGANGQAFVNWVNGFGGTHLGNLPHLVRNPPRPNLARVVNLHVARNQHVTRLFFLMTLTFNALWLPYQVLSYYRVFGDAEEVEGGLVTAAAWLSYGQVVVCPVVYFSSRGPSRPRPSRADLSPQDKQEYLLESVNRKK
ncbi:putative G-protein coupled receptor 85 [Babylonia areolata]|uniref:putative G-protein coupled receptor 85 n=1 Tax=Babylonia areolata TaxID=304850 RepID=UPI003FD633CA